MQSTTTEMRECVGCKTTMSVNNFEKNKKGVMLKTCMHCKKNEQDMKKRHRECFVKTIENESGTGKKLKRNLTRSKYKRKRLTENPTRIR